MALCGSAQVAVLIAAEDVPVAWRVVGLFLFAIAHVMFWSAAAAHGRNRPCVAFSTDVPERLVESGPYRLVRHPFYSAYLLAWIAGAAVTATPWLLATAGVMGLVYLTAARAEEAGFLASRVAEQYRSYQRRTGLFLPRLRERWTQAGAT
jgi:protein-S-isoprenylcysteine O-methyltransferase Ste14